MVSSVIDTITHAPSTNYDSRASPMKLKQMSEPHYWAPSEGASNDIVVFPSMTLDSPEDFDRFPGLEKYEERHLFALFLLQHIKQRIFFFSSYPLDPAIVEYYLTLMPRSSLHMDRALIKTTELDIGGQPGSLTELIPNRLYNICLHDTDRITLGEKLAKKYALMDCIKPLLRKNAQSFLLCYRTTEVEEKMAQQLGISLFGSPAELDIWGSKSGSRTLFQEAGVPHAMGIPLTYDVIEVATGIRQMIVRKSTVGKVVIKLDQFSAGGGNALLDLSPILCEGVVPSVQQILLHMSTMEMPFADMSVDTFLSYIQTYGAIVEEWLDGDEYCAPSAQGIIGKSGQVTMISTHEQLLQGQQYIGCKFPAAAGYRNTLDEFGARVGQVMSMKGVRGHFGVDFVVRRLANGEWEVNAIEINLRYTGTTGPYMTMRMLIPGTYDMNDGLYHATNGTAKYYAESDGVHVDGLEGLTADHIVVLCARHPELRFDPVTQTGPVFHMLGLSTKYSKVGVTCIADSADMAKDMLLNVPQYLGQAIADSKM